jgi:DNA topoisomerase IA
MKPALYAVTTVDVDTARAGKTLPYVFCATGRTLLTPGFMQVYDLPEKQPDEGDAPPAAQMPPLKQGEPLICQKLRPEQHFT